MPEKHERYSVTDASVLFEDTWGDADTPRCYRCGATVPEGSSRCPACGATFAECSRSCASCGLPRCVGGSRKETK